ncbi:unnamed protein product [Trichobilharzia szidati]|nr:unnamed protein product [Trichobilharzia szidati]CAH8838611.1 unnamed protein product [Trichobilharzia szidati]
MPVSQEEITSFTSRWTNRKLYTLMFVVYTPDESNTERPLVINDSGCEVHPEELCTNENTSWLLLGLKQRGFGKGRWNGFGGKVQSDDENPKAAALRELEEESGLVIEASAVEDVGRLWFTFTETTECMEVHVFICRKWMPKHCGDTVNWPCYTEEMHPFWFPLTTDKDTTVDTKHLPYNHMWPDDKIWLRYILQGNLLLGWFHFTQIPHLSNVSSQNLTDCSTETRGLLIDPYEVPAYHLDIFTDKNEIASNGDNNSDHSNLQWIIDQLGLDKCDEKLKLWMNSSLNQVSVMPMSTSSMLIKTLSYPLKDNTNLIEK